MSSFSDPVWESLSLTAATGQRASTPGSRRMRSSPGVTSSSSDDNYVDLQIGTSLDLPYPCLFYQNG